MGKGLLKKYKDLYFELGLNSEALNRAAEDLMEELSDAEPEAMLSEDCLNVFIKFTSFGRSYYRVLEINRKAGIDYVEKHYPELYRESINDCRFRLRDVSPDAEKEFAAKAKVYETNDYAIASDIQRSYVKERIKGSTHKQAIRALDEKYCVETLLQQKYRLFKEEKAEKEAEKAKKKTHNKTGA